MGPGGAGRFMDRLRRILRADASPTAPDSELLARFIAQRDEAAFEALMRRHGPMVWGVCRRLLVHDQDAEDAFQATFLVLVRKAASLGRRELLANWLFGVARRAALNARMRRARRAHQEQLCGDVLDMVPAREAPCDEISAVLDEELTRLPERYRLPLLLCGLEGMTHVEASRHLGWPTGTVAGRLSRGRALLRSRLVRRGVAVPGAAFAALLAKGTAAPAVPPPLLAAMLRGATVAVSPAVATLARGILRDMFLSRLLTTTMLLAVLALTLGGAGALWRLLSPGAAVAGQEPPSAAGVPPAAGPKLVLPADAKKPEIRLPADPSAVVLRLDRFVEPGTGLGTSMKIHADGRVVVELPEGLLCLVPTKLTAYAKNQREVKVPGAGPPPKNIQVVEGKLTAAELQELLRFAVIGQEWFDIDPAEVTAEYQSAKSASYGADALTTVLHIHTADRSHEVSWPLFSFHPQRVPAVKRLAQVHAVDLRLRNVFYVLLAGGPERVEEIVKLVNKHTRRHFPGAPHFTARDLAGVIPSANDAPARYTFSRVRQMFRNPEFMVWVDLPREGRPVFRFAPQLP